MWRRVGRSRSLGQCPEKGLAQLSAGDKYMGREELEGLEMGKAESGSGFYKEEPKLPASQEELATPKESWPSGSILSPASGDELEAKEQMRKLLEGRVPRYLEVLCASCGARELWRTSKGGVVCLGCGKASTGQLGGLGG